MPLLINWKFIIIVVVALAIVSAGVTVVLSYNHAVTKADQLERENLAQSELIVKQKNNMLRLNAYYAERDRRQVQTSNRRSQILTRKEKVDEKGTIAADDPTLLDLNRMFADPDSDRKTDTTGSSRLPAAAPG